MPEWFDFTPQMNLTVGQKYCLLHKSPEQKYNRLSVMTFLDSSSSHGLWNARPEGGTQTLPWSWLIAVCEAPATRAHTLNLDARMWSIPVPKEAPHAELVRLETEFEAAGGRGVELADRIDQLRRCASCREPEHATCSLTPGCPCCDDTITRMAEKTPVVTADDILTEREAQALALEAAFMLRQRILALHTQNTALLVTVSPASAQLAEVRVLGETAYVVDAEETLEELAKDFPAIGYLTTQGACVLTGAAGENADDCTTHEHEEATS
jgi:hypothetical protein